MLIGGELAGYRLHAEGPATGHNRNRVGVVDIAQHTRDVIHDLLE